MVNKGELEIREVPELNMNDFFRAAKEYCYDLRKEPFVSCRRLLDYNKREIIIFEADINKIDFSLINFKEGKKLFLPTDKIFVEIPKWKFNIGDFIAQNLGGIFIFNERIGDKNVITIYTLWLIIDIENRTSIKPLSMSYTDYIKFENKPVQKGYKVGSRWKSAQEGDITNGIKTELIEKTRKILFYLLAKVERKEYSKYKKWTPLGFTEHDITYSYEVSKHKRHFWKDSGRFKIPLMNDDELKDNGYEVDELVFRDGELRRDVPYKVIGNFLVGKDNDKKEDNRRIRLAKGRVWRCEEKIYRILRELYLDKIIKRHDRRTLKGIELDFNIPELRLGIEYDGEQHFDKVLYKKLYGDGFDAQVKRDRLKDRLCRRKNITLVRIKYDEPLTKTHIKKKLKEVRLL